MAAAKARWRLLAKACISKPGRNGNPTPGKEEYQHPVSRAVGSFGFIKSRVIDEVIAQKLSGDSLLAAISLHHTVSYDVVKPDGQSVKILLR